MPLAFLLSPAAAAYAGARAAVATAATRTGTDLRRLPHDTVLNETNIKGGDIIRPCPLVNFPGTYGALQCKANCDSSAQCRLDFPPQRTRRAVALLCQVHVWQGLLQGQWDVERLKK